MPKSPLTIINDGKLKGVLAPAGVVSKEVLEDVIDLIELSTPEAVAETERLIAEANRDNSWIPFDKVYARLKKPKKKREG